VRTARGGPVPYLAALAGSGGVGWRVGFRRSRPANLDEMKRLAPRPRNVEQGPTMAAAGSPFAGPRERGERNGRSGATGRGVCFPKGRWRRHERRRRTDEAFRFRGNQRRTRRELWAPHGAKSVSAGTNAEHDESCGLLTAPNRFPREPTPNTTSVGSSRRQSVSAETERCAEPPHPSSESAPVPVEIERLVGPPSPPVPLPIFPSESKPLSGPLPPLVTSPQSP
jgi:hypothetical protein